MTAKVLYTANGTDPANITWPAAGPNDEVFAFQSGVVTVIPSLIGYGDGSILFPDGRKFPAVTPQGSSFVHVEGVGGEA